MIHNTSHTLRLSVIVNMYNTAKYMQKCVDSLLCQDIPAEEYEIIFVDDCSPDESLEMANHFKEEGLRIKEQGGSYPQIKVCHHEVNKGLAAARNTGVAAAEGKYLRFVDPDDYVEKNSFKTLLDQMDAENLDILRFDYQKVDEDYNPIPHNHAEQQLNLTPGIMKGAEFLATRLGIACYVWPYIYRTALVKGKNNIAFIEDCYLDDVPWLPRVLMAAGRLNCLPRKCQYYLIRQGSMVRTASVMRKITGQLRVIELLTEQAKSIHHPSSIIHHNVMAWYKREINFAAFSIMSSITALDKVEAMSVINQLRRYGCFPLRLEAYNKKSMILKQIAINVSPRFYWRMFKNVIKNGKN